MKTEIMKVKGDCPNCGQFAYITCVNRESLELIEEQEDSDGKNV